MYKWSEEPVLYNAVVFAQVDTQTNVGLRQSDQVLEHMGN